MADDWDADLYDRFKDARGRALEDLLGRVPALDPLPGRPLEVLDAGCGTGAGLTRLYERYPDARLVGLDSSPRMLAVAAERAPSATLVAADLDGWQPERPFDLVVCNAVLHWLPDHAAAIDRLYSWVAPGGVLALQVPDNQSAAAPMAVRAVQEDDPWRERLGDLVTPPPAWLPEAYAAFLGERGADVDAWVTRYVHVLDDVEDAVAWLTATTLRPHLARLGDDAAARAGFLADVRAAVEPVLDRVGSRVLFPFRRVFAVARRPGVRLGEAAR